MLEIKGVKKVYRTNGLEHTALRNVNLNFRASEFAAILGPSGSGKTTLLNIIGGLDQYTAGDLVIDGKSTKSFKDKDWDAYRNHRIGFVFQNYNLIPHQTVLQNVRLALTLSGVSKRESIRRAKHVLKEVGLEEHIDKKPAQLSGGQMQRVAIARALVNDPDIVLADEPTGALDSNTSVQIMDILAKIATDKLVIMVTHNPDLADKYASRIITLKDGRIMSDSDPFSSRDARKNVVAHKSAVSAKARKAKKHGKTKMTFLTALSLSMKNLLTKKARTILIAIAGSIGIIGIALISAVSTGFQNYIDSIEKDTLTSYPLTLMQESTDITSVLLSITGQGEGSSKENTVIENQELTGALGTVSHNDLPSFMNYYNINAGKLKNDVRLVEREYNVDPLIYTVDRSGKLAKLNPSNLFSSLIGDTSLLSSYSSLTSVFQQQELANMQEESSLVAGRWPENYDEMVISLRDPKQIPDLMTYSLGFHDTEKLNEILTQILSGEGTSETEAPLELTYDELMGADLRLVPNTDVYRYNSQYNIYEDMSDDESFMRMVYDSESEPLKIVGIITPNSDMAGAGNGVFYLPSLVTHIIEESSETEIVKKQLAEPEVDVFTGKKFGEEGTGFDFEFSDLVSVDNVALEQAFGVTIDQNEVTARTEEYMGEINQDIDTGTGEIPTTREALEDKLQELAGSLSTEFNQNMHEKFEERLKELSIASPDYADKLATLMQEMTNYVTEFTINDVDSFVAEQDFSGYEAKYAMPAQALAQPFSGLLKLYMSKYGPWYLQEVAKTLQSKEAPMNSPSLPEDATFPAENMTEFMNDANVTAALDALSVATGQIYLKQTILTKVGGLTQYLTSSFANSFHVDQNALVGAFHLNYTDEELQRLIATMFNQKEVSLTTNLSELGYQNLDEPTRIAFYFASFDGKTNFMQFLDDYNNKMSEAGEDDKVIEYSDTTGVLMSSVKVIVDAVSYVLIAFVSISLIVSSIMIGVITYISVYERTKEIGILRAIGASKHNISSIFNAETFIIGLLAGLFGITISYLLIPVINLVLHHFTGDIPLNAALAPGTAIALIALSVVLTLIGGLIPAHSASKKDPVEALRSE